MPPLVWIEEFLVRLVLVVDLLRAIRPQRVHLQAVDLVSEWDPARAVRFEEQVVAARDPPTSVPVICTPARSEA